MTRKLFLPAREVELSKGRYLTSPVWIERIGATDWKKVAKAYRGDSNLFREAFFKCQENQRTRVGGIMSSKSCIGAAEEVERGVWYRTHVKRDGSRLTATTYLCAAGNPQVFSVSVDMARIAKKLAQYHRGLHKSEPNIGRDATPRYSKALRRRIMSCRADCEQNLFSGVDDDTLNEIVGCMYRPRMGATAKTQALSTSAKKKVINFVSQVESLRAEVTDLKLRLLSCQISASKLINQNACPNYGYVKVSGDADDFEVADDIGDDAITRLGGHNWKKAAKEYRLDRNASEKIANKLRKDWIKCELERNRIPRVGANTGFDTEADEMFGGLHTEDLLVGLAGNPEAEEIFSGFFDSITKPFRKVVEKIGKAKLVQGITKGIGDAVKIVAEPQKALDLMAKAGNIKIGPIPVGAFYGPWLADQAARKVLGKKLYNAGAKVAVNAAMTAFPPLKVANMAARLATAKDPAEAAKLIPGLKVAPMAANVTAAFSAAKVSPEAALAFNASRTALVAIEKDAALRKSLQNLSAEIKKLPALKARIAQIPAAERASFLARNPALKEEIFRALKAKATSKIIRATGGVEKIKKVQKVAMLARNRVKTVVEKARAGDEDAKKLAKVIAIVQTARTNTKNVAAAAKGGLTGIVIDESGNITRGKFTNKGSKSPQMFVGPGGKKTRGAFTKVAGGVSFGCECDGT